MLREYSYLSVGLILPCEHLFLEGVTRDQEGITGGTGMNELFFPAGIQILVPDSSRLQESQRPELCAL